MCEFICSWDVKGAVSPIADRKSGEYLPRFSSLSNLELTESWNGPYLAAFSPVSSIRPGLAYLDGAFSSD